MAEDTVARLGRRWRRGFGGGYTLPMVVRSIVVAGLCAMSCSHRPPAEPAAANQDLACRDFYQYVNHAWLASAKIPADEERWGVREDMRRRTRDKLHAILESLRAVPSPRNLEAKLGVFYGTCMDARRADSDGAGPLRAQLARIDAIDAPDALVREIGRLHLEGVPALFWFAAGQDPRRSADVIAEAGAWSVEGDTTDILGLPDRDDYLRAGADAERLRTEYVAHVARTLVLSGLANPEADGSTPASADPVSGCRIRGRSGACSPCRTRSTRLAPAHPPCRGTANPRR